MSILRTVDQNSWRGAWWVLAACLACPLGAARAQSADQQPPPKLVVLNSGRVLEGRVQRYGEGYIVRWGEHGEAQVSDRMVDFVCDSLEEAYATLRKRITRPSLNSHLSLAEWCLANGLLARAQDQWVEAAALRNSDPRVAALQRRIQSRRDQLAQARERTAADSISAEAGGSAERPRMLVGPAPFEEPSRSEPAGQPAESLVASAPSFSEVDPVAMRRAMQGLPGPAVREFNLRVQPMLLSSCATAACHSQVGEGPRPRLIPAVGNFSLPARHSNRNLLELLEFVNSAAPSQSPLLELAKRPHGGNADGGPSFAGLGERQQVVLEAWLHAIAAASRNASGGLDLAARAVLLESPSEQPETIRRVSGEAVPPPAAGLDEDPFDPEIFNRRYNRPPPSGSDAGSESPAGD